MGSFKLGKMTFGSLFKKPETLLYPFQTKTPPEGLKGVVALDANKCGLCAVCVKKCPCDSIQIDKKARTWSINHYSCVQCGSCVRECTKDCLYMLPNAPCVTANFVPEVVFVPEKPKKSAANAGGAGGVEGAGSAVQGTNGAAQNANAANSASAGGAAQGANGASQNVKDTAQGGTSALQGSSATPQDAQNSEIIIEPTGDADMDAKLAKMDPEKALKVRAAFMAKRAKETT